jgi:hypothetical protein
VCCVQKQFTPFKNALGTELPADMNPCRAPAPYPNPSQGTLPGTSSWTLSGGRWQRPNFAAEFHSHFRGRTSQPLSLPKMSAFRKDPHLEGPRHNNRPGPYLSRTICCEAARPAVAGEKCGLIVTYRAACDARDCRVRQAARRPNGQPLPARPPESSLRPRRHRG